MQRILASKVQPEDREAAVRANIMRKGRLSHAKSSGSLGSVLHRAVGKKPRGMAAAVAEAQAAAAQAAAALAAVPPPPRLASTYSSSMIRVTLSQWSAMPLHALPMRIAHGERGPRR